METLLDSLIRYYESEGRDTVVTDSTAVAGIEGRLLDLASHDNGTFPYLP